MEGDKETRKHESKKHLWLITYTADSVNITSEMLRAAGVVCDECHTVAWRESKYSLVHLTKANRIRGGRLRRVLGEFRSQYGIKQSLIVGYDTLCSNDKVDSSIEEHPGFKQIVHALNHAPDQLQSWMAQGDVKTNRKGCLWRFLDSVDPRHKTRGQLVAQLLEWAPLIRQQAADLDAVRAELEVRVHELRRVGQKYKRLKELHAAQSEELKRLRGGVGAQ